MIGLKRFLSDESAAITVDWTVLAASVVGLGITTVGLVQTGTNAMGTDISTSLSAASVVRLRGLDGFVFTAHTDAQVDNIWAIYHARPAATLRQNANTLINLAVAAIESGDLETAQYWTERVYIAAHVMDERNMTPLNNVPTAEDLVRRIQEAAG